MNIPITQILRELQLLYPTAKLVEDGSNVQIGIHHVTILVNEDSLYISPDLHESHISVFFSDYDNINKIIATTVQAVNLVKDIVKVNSNNKQYVII